MKKLIYQIASSIARALEQPRPNVKRMAVSSLRVKVEVDDMKLKMLYPALLDHFQDYYYLTSSQWAEVLDYIYFRFDMPSYITARMDCEDFAILLKSLVSAFFGLNSFAVVLGKTPAGYHGWNLFRTEDGWLQLEPQTGKIFELKEKGYEPERILI